MEPPHPVLARVPILETRMKEAADKKASPDPFRPLPKSAQSVDAGPEPHIFRRHVCITDSRGFATHRNLDRFTIRVDNDPSRPEFGSLKVIVEGGK